MSKDQELSERVTEWNISKLVKANLPGYDLDDHVEFYEGNGDDVHNVPGNVNNGAGNVNVPAQEPRRSSRIRRPPRYLRDYVTS